MAGYCGTAASRATDTRWSLSDSTSTRFDADPATRGVSAGPPAFHTSHVANRSRIIAMPENRSAMPVRLEERMEVRR